MSCEYLEHCPIFERREKAVLDKVFITLYCKGPQVEKCKRRILKKNGKDVPLSLLPTGEHYKNLFNKEF
ncbi:MAG: hypothetical protein JXB50_04485, partial [Spirochaetes bacterium]|nr:hypothetical protein [Spirochaetota bacterium]